jgi:glutathione S-transferase
MPREPKGRTEVLEWLFAALNSVEMASLPWPLFKFSGQSEKRFDDFLKLRLDRLEPVVAKREWLAGSFSVADILMADVLRLVDRFDEPRARSEDGRAGMDHEQALTAPPGSPSPTPLRPVA